MMVTSFVKPTLPGKGVETIIKETIAPFKLPEKGKDEVFCYVTAIKQDSPFDYQYFDGVDFSKGVYHPDASLKKNDGKKFFPMLQTKLLTEKQAEAIWERAKKRIKKINDRPNLDYDYKDPDSKSFLKPLNILVADYLILCKQKEYKPFEDERKLLERQAEEINQELDLAAELSEKILEAQHPNPKSIKNNKKR